MPPFLSGPGLGLALPQNLYPTELGNAPYDANNNQICLAAGQELPIPAGDWYVSLGMYLQMEFLDPVTGIWTWAASGGWGSFLHITSDGFNIRIANRLGCPIGGIITAYGGSYVQASTTITAVGSTSTWLPVIGGQMTFVSNVTNGAGYGVAPIVIIPAPAPASNNPNGVGGVQASGYATIANGTVSGFTFTNPGAGYTAQNYNIVALPNPTDPNLPTGITQATLQFSVTGSGSLTAALCTNPGAPLATLANITLTVGGAGTQATVIPAMLQTITAASVIGGTTVVGSSFAALTSAGGGYSLGTITNSPEFLGLKFKPRPAQISLTVGAAGTIAAQVGTIIDGGLFASPPNAILQIDNLAAASGTIVGNSTIVYTMGSRSDIAILQPAP